MAGEPESLSTHEPLAKRIARHDYDRLIMLSDGVFAIAITLLALEIQLPEEWDGSLGSLFYGSGRSLIGYVFGFFLVGAFWIAHRRLFAKVVIADRVISLLNIVLLGFIGLVPFVARLIAEKGPTRSMSVYLLLTGTIFASYAIIYTVAGARSLLHPQIATRRWRREAVGLSIGAALVLAGAIASFAWGLGASPILLVVIALGAGTAARAARRLPADED